MSFENPKNPESEPVPEFNFEDGVKEVMTRIIKALEDHEPVVVGFSASGAHVGKTFLAQTLFDELTGRGIAAIFRHDTEKIEAEKERFEAARPRVIIFDELQQHAVEDEDYDFFKAKYEEKLKSAMSSFYPIRGIDLWVGICRPDSPFAGRPIADLVIRNEKAKDK